MFSLIVDAEDETGDTTDSFVASLREIPAGAPDGFNNQAFYLVPPIESCAASVPARNSPKFQFCVRKPLVERLTRLSLGTFPGRALD
ncbi:MAG: hypothetical protein AAFV88_17015 [Planctomycetota bacterium]